ncbi:hypothetical protein MBLNU459_g6524t1 [Dothideomycetes sp. NU459]
MLFTTLLSSVALPLLAAASPVVKRAGGPAFKPLADNCTIINPLPQASEHYGNGTVNGWTPSASAMNNTVYSFYLEQPDFETLDKRWEGCLEQCNGLDGCKSALLAYNAPTPKGYYGTAGGVPEVGCLMFGVYLTPYDFVTATNGTFVNETAANIYC